MGTNLRNTILDQNKWLKVILDQEQSREAVYNHLTVTDNAEFYD
jgi:hypothetical protein